MPHTAKRPTHHGSCPQVAATARRAAADPVSVGAVTRPAAPGVHVIVPYEAPRLNQAAARALLALLRRQRERLDRAG